MFCAPGLIFGGTRGIGFRFHVLRFRTRFQVLHSRTHFWLYRGCRVPFLCFALPDSFLTELTASGPVFMFSLPDPFSTIPRASGPICMFYSPEPVFGDTDGVGSRFHVLRSLARFQRYRRRRVPFAGFALPDSLSTVPRASCPVFKFCTPRLIFGSTEGVLSRFHVLRFRTRFRRYRRRRVPFSCFALPDSFPAVPTPSGPVLEFCAPGLIFGAIEGFGTRFHVLRCKTHFRRYRGRRVPF
jgi:hypothetical protein